MQPEKALILSDYTLRVTLTRDTNKGHMYSATMLHPADLVQGGTYEVSGCMGCLGGLVRGADADQRHQHEPHVHIQPPSLDRPLIVQGGTWEESR